MLTYDDSPWNQLHCSLSSVKFTRFPSSFGNSPAKKRKYQQTHNTCMRGIQFAFELIDVQPEHGQVDELAELLGQYSCQKATMSANTQRMYIYWDIQILPPSPQYPILRCIKLVRAPHSDGITPRNLVMLPKRTPRSSTSSEIGSSLGNSPAKSENVSEHTTHIC